MIGVRFLSGLGILFSPRTDLFGAHPHHVNEELLRGDREVKLDADQSNHLVPNLEMCGTLSPLRIHGVVLECRKALPEEPSTMQAVHKTNVYYIVPLLWVTM
jgi:hypothetical protein